jgi:hypothetical protein
MRFGALSCARMIGGEWKRREWIDKVPFSFSSGCIALPVAHCERSVRNFVDTLGYPETTAITEVERYCVWPGQACALEPKTGVSAA